MSSGPRGGGAASLSLASAAAAAAARVMWAAFFFFFFSSQFTWKGVGGGWSSQSGKGLLFAYRSGFFFPLYSNRIGLLHEKEAFS